MIKKPKGDRDRDEPAEESLHCIEDAEARQPEPLAMSDVIMSSCRLRTPLFQPSFPAEHVGLNRVSPAMLILQLLICFP